MEHSSYSIFKTNLIQKPKTEGGQKHLHCTNNFFLSLVILAKGQYFYLSLSHKENDSADPYMGVVFDLIYVNVFLCYMIT